VQSKAGCETQQTFSYLAKVCTTRIGLYAYTSIPINDDVIRQFHGAVHMLSMLCLCVYSKEGNIERQTRLLGSAAAGGEALE